MRFVLLLLIVSSSAFADLMPEPEGVVPELSCVGQAEGAACGDGGRCAKVRVRRPDFSSGGVPTWGLVDVMVCRGARAPATLGIGLAAIAAAISLWWLRSRGSSSPRQTAS